MNENCVYAAVALVLMKRISVTEVTVKTNDMGKVVHLSCANLLKMHCPFNGRNFTASFRWNVHVLGKDFQNVDDKGCKAILGRGGGGGFF